MTDGDAPYHAHIYMSEAERASAAILHDDLTRHPHILLVGTMTKGKAGPHPIGQFEIHFLERSLPEVIPLIEASGLRALVHPLTDDDLADHTALGRWIGEPVELDLSVLDPPGQNKGLARFGQTDF